MWRGEQRDDRNKRRTFNAEDAKPDSAGAPAGNAGPHAETGKWLCAAHMRNMTSHDRSREAPIARPLAALRSLRRGRWGGQEMGPRFRGGDKWGAGATNGTRGRQTGRGGRLGGERPQLSIRPVRRSTPFFTGCGGGPGRRNCGLVGPGLRLRASRAAPPTAGSTAVSAARFRGPAGRAAPGPPACCCRTRGARAATGTMAGASCPRR